MLPSTNVLVIHKLYFIIVSSGEIKPKFLPSVQNSPSWLMTCMDPFPGNEVLFLDTDHVTMETVTKETGVRNETEAAVVMALIRALLKVRSLKYKNVSKCFT